MAIASRTIKEVTAQLYDRSLRGIPADTNPDTLATVPARLGQAGARSYRNGAGAYAAMSKRRCRESESSREQAAAKNCWFGSAA